MTVLAKEENIRQTSEEDKENHMTSEVKRHIVIKGRRIQKRAKKVYFDSDETESEDDGSSSNKAKRRDAKPSGDGKRDEQTGMFGLRNVLPAKLLSGKILTHWSDNAKTDGSLLDATNSVLSMIASTSYDAIFSPNSKDGQLEDSWNCDLESDKTNSGETLSGSTTTLSQIPEHERPANDLQMSRTAGSSAGFNNVQESHSPPPTPPHIFPTSIDEPISGKAILDRTLTVGNGPDIVSSFGSWFSDIRSATKLAASATVTTAVKKFATNAQNIIVTAANEWKDVNSLGDDFSAISNKSCQPEQPDSLVNTTNFEPSTFAQSIKANLLVDGDALDKETNSSNEFDAGWDDWGEEETEIPEADNENDEQCLDDDIEIPNDTAFSMQSIRPAELAGKRALDDETQKSVQIETEPGWDDWGEETSLTEVENDPIAQSDLSEAPQNDTLESFCPNIESINPIEIVPEKAGNVEPFTNEVDVAWADWGEEKKTIPEVKIENDEQCLNEDIEAAKESASLMKPITSTELVDKGALGEEKQKSVQIEPGWDDWSEETNIPEADNENDGHYLDEDIAVAKDSAFPIQSINSTELADGSVFEQEKQKPVLTENDVGWKDWCDETSLTEIENDPIVQSDISEAPQNETLESFCPNIESINPMEIVPEKAGKVDAGWDDWGEEETEIPEADNENDEQCLDEDIEIPNDTAFSMQSIRPAELADKRALDVETQKSVQIEIEPGWDDWSEETSLTEVENDPIAQSDLSEVPQNDTLESFCPNIESINPIEIVPEKAGNVDVGLDDWGEEENILETGNLINDSVELSQKANQAHQEQKVSALSQFESVQNDEQCLEVTKQPSLTNQIYSIELTEKSALGEEQKPEAQTELDAGWDDWGEEKTEIPETEQGHLGSLEYSDISPSQTINLDILAENQFEPQESAQSDLSEAPQNDTLESFCLNIKPINSIKIVPEKAGNVEPFTNEVDAGWDDWGEEKTEIPEADNETDEQCLDEDIEIPNDTAFLMKPITSTELVDKSALGEEKQKSVQIEIDSGWLGWSEETNASEIENDLLTQSEISEPSPKDALESFCLNIKPINPIEIVPEKGTNAEASTKEVDVGLDDWDEETNILETGNFIIDSVELQQKENQANCPRKVSALIQCESVQNDEQCLEVTKQPSLTNQIYSIDLTEKSALGEEEQKPEAQTELDAGWDDWGEESKTLEAEQGHLGSLEYSDISPSRNIKLNQFEPQESAQSDILGASPKDAVEIESSCPNIERIIPVEAVPEKATNAEASTKKVDVDWDDWGEENPTKATISPNRDENRTTLSSQSKSLKQTQMGKTKGNDCLSESRTDFLLAKTSNSASISSGTASSKAKGTRKAPKSDWAIDWTGEWETFDQINLKSDERRSSTQTDLSIDSDWSADWEAKPKAKAATKPAPSTASTSRASFSSTDGHLAGQLNPSLSPLSQLSSSQSFGSNSLYGKPPTRLPQTSGQSGSWFSDISSAARNAASSTVNHAVSRWSFNPTNILDAVVDNLSNVVGVPSAEEMATVMRKQQQKK